LKDPFSLIFKNISFEALSQICRPIKPSFLPLFVVNGIEEGEARSIAIAIENFTVGLGGRGKRREFLNAACPARENFWTQFLSQVRPIWG